MMVRISVVGRIRRREAQADEGNMAIFALLLSTAIACSALLMPAFAVAQDLAASRPDASSEFENTAWKLIRNSDDPADFETYLEIYPTGRFNRVARQRVSELTEQPRISRAIVLAPVASADVPVAPQPQLPATRSAESKLAASRPLTPPRKKPDVVPTPAAYVPARAPQPQLPATRPAEPKRVADVASLPVTKPKPVDSFGCAMDNVDLD